MAGFVRGLPALAALMAGCSAPAPPPLPTQERGSSPPSPVPPLTLQLEAQSAVNDRHLEGLTVEVDGQPARELAAGRYQAAVGPGPQHGIRLTQASCLPLTWSGSLEPGERILARLAPHGIRVVGFGDSLTAGLKVDPGARFVMKLVGLVQGARSGFWVDFRDRGHSGDTYLSAFSRLSLEVLAVNPDVTIVEFGTNDVATTPLDRFPASVDAVLTPLARVCPRILVADVPFKPRWYGGWNQQVAPFNQALAAAAARHRATLVSLSEAFRAEAARQWGLFEHDAPYDETLPDSRWQGDVHPNAAGNELIARTLAAAILEATRPGIATASP